MKLTIVLFFSMFFTAIIVAPASFLLLGIDQEIEILLNLNEEERNKESNKELEEKEVFYYEPYTVIPVKPTSKSVLSTSYVERYYDMSLEVFLPPPK
ncbi:hypothetical protein ACFQZJ_16820 [Maribacter chungangensis]|uniref:Uncharacterized protein n=1 Tax=Maribacter chungangensis TaxID=1069117 RepID=A0ABW3B7P3_9FLAO